MKGPRTVCNPNVWGLVLAVLLLAAPSIASAQACDAGSEEKRRCLDIYGIIQTDVIHDFEQVDRFWFDVLRPSKLPSFPEQFGRDGNQYFSVRQTRFGTKVHWPTKKGDVYGIFEWELFGVGVDQGQTTFRLRHAYIEMGKFGAGQTWSVFMDPDVFPNELEYWGPNGMVFFRNVQVRWMPIKGESNLMFAIERPGASGDRGDFADRIELQNVLGRFPAPDLTAHGRVTRKWGYFQLGGIVRWLDWDDLIRDDVFDLSGSATGWGVALSTNLKMGSKTVLKAQGVIGNAIQNYMNDAPADVGIVLHPLSVTRPIEGEGLPMWSMLAFLDHTWDDDGELTSSIGYSRLDIDNTDGQSVLSFQNGQYAIANLLYHPTENLMVGGEVQWGRRQNFEDAIDINDEFPTSFENFHVDDWRVQFSARFNFSFKFWKDPPNDK